MGWHPFVPRAVESRKGAWPGPSFRALEQTGWRRTRHQRDHCESAPRPSDAQGEGRLAAGSGHKGRAPRVATCAEALTVSDTLTLRILCTGRVRPPNCTSLRWHSLRQRVLGCDAVKGKKRARSRTELRFQNESKIVCQHRTRGWVGATFLSRPSQAFKR